MSKKPRAKRADALNQMGSLIFMLTRVYPDQAAAYRKHVADHRKWDALVSSSPTPRIAANAERWRDQSERFADKYRGLCVEMVEKLSDLARLVAHHFPEFDGKLRDVQIHAEHWHNKPPEQWDNLLEELGRIQAAVLRAAPSLHATKPSKRRGRREIPLDEIRDKLDEVERIGISSYCQREGIDPSTISRWRTRLKKP